MARYDTNGQGLEPGIHTVKVIAYPQEKDAKGFTKIDFEFEIQGDTKPLKQSYFPNQIKSMFAALGFKEVEPGVFDGNIQEAFGKSFKAELYTEEYKKQDGTMGRARRLRNFEALGPEDVVWDE